jgi:hypothetical protein
MGLLALCCEGDRSGVDGQPDAIERRHAVKHRIGKVEEDSLWSAESFANNLLFRVLQWHLGLPIYHLFESGASVGMGMLGCRNQVSIGISDPYSTSA